MSGPEGIEALERRVAVLEALLAGTTPSDRTLASEPPIAAIVGDAAFAMGLRVSEIISAGRSRPLFRARCAITWAAREATLYSFPRIAYAIGRSDHTVTLNCYRQAKKLRSTDPAFKGLTDRLAAAAKLRAAAREREMAA